MGSFTNGGTTKRFLFRCFPTADTIAMLFWWVNHRQTWREEIDGEYLWSPMQEAHGRKSIFYDNMRRATRGDVIVSYAHKEICHWGIVMDDAIAAPKPDFGASGSYWSSEGWILPVKWSAFIKPILLETIIEQLRPLLPEKYSPLERDRDRGAQKAYLTEIGQHAFDLIRQYAYFELPSLLEIPAPFKRIENDLADIAERLIRENQNLSDTEKEEIIRSRRGQGLFRKCLEAIEPNCRITGITNRRLLIASHIKPWRSCISTSERLSGYNGLLLTPTIDYLFDRGWISFQDNGELLVSPRLPQYDQKRIGLPGSEVSRPFTAEQQIFLNHHRSVTFLDST
ncbi:MAG TPA: HNH endonuclease [Candidatus Baltobacteraceae bacterium]|nr:HNH endonuclease [Candidatus Baltobacteraceae bacterium]